jgi:sporulation protein YlmC with PRC-barrel domain
MKKTIPLVAATILTFAGSVYATDVAEKRKELVEQQQDVKEAQKELNQETIKATAEQVQKVNESMQQVSRASKIIGTTVKDAQADKLGDIKDLVIDPESGQIVYAVVSFGGVLGLGDKLFAVPWTALHWTRDKEYYVLNVDKSALKKAPGFDKKHWPDSADKWDRQREEIDQFYSVKPQ